MRCCIRRWLGWRGAGRAFDAALAAQVLAREFVGAKRAVVTPVASWPRVLQLAGEALGVLALEHGLEAGLPGHFVIAVDLKRLPHFRDGVADAGDLALGA